MGGLIGLILVVVAGVTIVGVLFLVLREQHTHEEHYIPPANRRDADSAATGVGESTVADDARVIVPPPITAAGSSPNPTGIPVIAAAPLVVNDPEPTVDERRADERPVPPDAPSIAQ